MNRFVRLIPLIWLFTLASMRPLSSHAADSVVVFNEVFYQSEGETVSTRWIELYNQMAVDIDLSAWRIAGDMDFVFPEGTILPGGEFLLIAEDPVWLGAAGVRPPVLGPLQVNLPSNGGSLRLRDRNGRLMDALDFSSGGGWPVAPSGSGATLAKIRPESASRPAENWAGSAQRGGTPGRSNFPTGLPRPDLVLNEILPFDGQGRGLELLNRGNQILAQEEYALIFSGGGRRETVALPEGELRPGNLQTVIATSPGLSNATRVFLLKSAENRILDAAELTDRVRGRWPDGADAWRFLSEATPSASNRVALTDSVVINEIMYHPPPHLEVPGPFEPGALVTNGVIQFTNQWRYDASGTDRGTAWREPAFDDSLWPSGRGLFYATTSSLQAPKSTPLALGPTTYYFRTAFEFHGTATALTLRHIIDDGAVVYLNGVELLRQRMPPGNPIAYDTRASSGVGIATLITAAGLPATALRSGTNVIAVELHQAPSPGNDAVFGLELTVSGEAAPLRPHQESRNEWIELFNRGKDPVDLGGWRLEQAIDYRFAPNTWLAPGGFLVVAKEPATLQSSFPDIRVLGPHDRGLSRGGERIVLTDRFGNPADEVRYFDGGRWPQAADGGGSSLELRESWADNQLAESWAASDESRRSRWQRYTYRGVAVPSFRAPIGSPDGTGLDSQWREFVMGLLDAGEIWLDDLEVIESPDDHPVSLLPNGTFDLGLDHWRLLGNHQGEVIEDPEQPGNRVLRLVATGPTEHLSNHGETTLRNDLAVVEGRVYQISFRAKWVSGCRRLNTRLYFNRVARTTVLEAPAVAGTPGQTNSRAVPNLGPSLDAMTHNPVVPGAGDPVTVSIRAADVQGVKAVRLWYARDGGAWSSLSMQPVELDPTVYQATVPGQSAGAVVQFYVEAVDERGAIARHPAAGADSRAMYQVNDGRAATNGLHNFRIVMRPDDVARLHDPLNAVSDALAGCTVISDEREVYYDAGIRLKGSEVGRLPPDVLGFFVQFPADHLFRGIHRSVGIERNGAGHGQREMLVHQTFNHAGGLPTKYHDLIRVLTPKPEMTRAAELQLARYTDTFLDDQYENGSDGIMFEYEIVYRLTRTDTRNPEGRKVPEGDGWVGTTIQDLGPSKENYRWTFLVENNRNRDDYSRLMPFARALGQTGPAFTESIHRYIDVDQWLRAFAASVLSGTSDNYGAVGDVHNGQFWIRPGDQRVLFFPHDLDLLVDANRSIAHGDLAKLLGVPGYARAYYRHLRDLLSTTCNTNYMARWTASYGRLLPEQNFGQHLAFYVQLQTNMHRQINAAAPPVVFSILSNAGRDFSTNQGAVTLEGNAWLDVARIEVNGVAYDTGWKSPTRWTMNLPLVSGENRLNLQGVDDAGRRRTDLFDTILVTNTGSAGLLPVVINEWMADNQPPGGLVTTPEGDYPDWFELFNPNPVAVNLGGYHLTDDLAQPTQWTFPPNFLVPPRGFLLVLADGKEGFDQAAGQPTLHVSFRLNAQGETLGLFSPGGIAPQHVVAFGAQVANVSGGLVPDGSTNSLRSLPDWTPGAPNRAGVPDSPQIRDFRVQAGVARLQFGVTLGRNYRLESVDRLDGRPWTQLGSLSRAVGEFLTFTDPDAGTAQRFYRLVLVP